MIQVRRLVAVELTYLGPKIIIAEYAIAVVVGLVVGFFSLRAGLLITHATWQVFLGMYLLFVALTYAVLLAYAVLMAKRGDYQDEISAEAEAIGPKAMFRKYRRQSMWLLLPLIVPVVALKEGRGSGQALRPGPDN